MQISGGHRYQPPRQDVYAPDLYIPFMAVCTYIVLFSIVQTAEGKFTHDSMYITVRSPSWQFEELRFLFQAMPDGA